MTIFRFSIGFGLPPPGGLRLIPSLHNSHKRTTAGRHILSTSSLTLFEVLRSMIVLQPPKSWTNPRQVQLREGQRDLDRLAGLYPHQ